MGISAKEKFKKLPKERQARINKLADEFKTEYKTLQELRKALGITQKMVADHQGVNQVNISNLEKRSDMLISTLRKYVEALGCELEINIKVMGNAVVSVENLPNV